MIFLLKPPFIGDFLFPAMFDETRGYIHISTLNPMKNQHFPMVFLRFPHGFPQMTREPTYFAKNPAPAPPAFEDVQHRTGGTEVGPGRGEAEKI